ncbi:MAG: hypothetical protein ABI779_14325 [Acidobacteriota bacterium]
MNEITVIIAGMVLLVSTNAYMPQGTDIVRAGLAIEAGESIDSVYDVDIQPHHAQLSVPTDAIDGAKLTVSKRALLDKRLGPNDGGRRTLRLLGDRVQLGKWETTCKPLPESATAIRDATALPRLGEIVGPDVMLASRTFPSGKNYDNYTTINTKLVAGWLEIQGGRLHALRSPDPTDDEVEFRPSRRRVALSPAVEWFPKSNDTDCLLITPFSGIDEIMIPFLPGPVIVRYEVMAHQSSGEGIVGIGYDYELFYELLKSKPRVPPIPYAIISKIEVDPDTGERVNGSTGVNCGPPKIK